MMKATLVALFVLVASPVMAQPVGIVTINQQIFASGVPTTGTPGWTASYPITSLLCNQTPVVPPVPDVNPQHFEVDDPSATGKVCIGVFSPTLLASLPPSIGYTSTVTYVDASGQESVRSAASNPFNRTPNAPTGYKVTP